MLKRTSILAAVVVLGMMVAIACASAATPTPTKAKPTPTYGGTLRYGLFSPLKSLDPVWTTAGVTHDAARQVFDTLVTEDEVYTPQPNMLESWRASSDSKIWTFTLRKGMKFHDGTAITTDDVIASMKRWGDRVSLGKQYYGFVESISKGNDVTWTVRFKVPFTLAFNYLAAQPYIYPARMAATPAAESMKEWTGSGPFKVSTWKVGDRLVLEPFKDYKSRPEPPSGDAGARISYVDRVEMIEVPDPATLVAAVQAGQLDFARNLPSDLYAGFKGKPGLQFNLFHSQLNTTVLNNAILPFSHPKARQALREVTVAAEHLAATYPPGIGSECPALFFCGTQWETDEAAELIYRRPARIEEGRRLWREFVRETGWSGKIQLWTNTTYKEHYAMSQVTLRDLTERLGVQVDYRVTDWATLVTVYQQRQGWHIFHSRQTFGERDPFVARYLAADSYGYTAAPELRALRDQFATALTDKERFEIVQKVQRLVYEQAYIIPHGMGAIVDLVGPTVKGLTPRKTAPYVSLWNAWVTR